MFEEDAATLRILVGARVHRRREGDEGVSARRREEQRRGFVHRRRIVNFATNIQKDHVQRRRLRGESLCKDV